MANYEIVKEYVGNFFRGEIVPEELLPGDATAMAAEGTIRPEGSLAPRLPTVAEAAAAEAEEAYADQLVAAREANPQLVGDPFADLEGWPNEVGGMSEQPLMREGGGDAAQAPTAVSAPAPMPTSALAPKPAPPSTSMPSGMGATTPLVETRAVSALAPATPQKEEVDNG